MKILFSTWRFRWYLFGGLLLLLVLFPLSVPFSEWQRVLLADDSSYILIDADETWSDTYTIADNAEVFVSPDVTVTILPGTKILFGKKSVLTIAGSVVARGTMTNLIVFDRATEYGQWDSYRVSIQSGGSLRLENARVKGGGIYQNIYMVDNTSQQPGKRGIFWTADAELFAQGAIQVNANGRLDAEEVMFQENNVAVQASESARVKIWRSQFILNIQDVISTAQQSNFDARYNWWNDVDGPQRDNSSEQLKKITGNIDFSDWATEVYQKDPVVIVPGMFGSWAYSDLNDLELDPVRHTYDDLISTFTKNGYTLNTNLFLFPYNWRASNVDSATLLAQKIAEIKAQTHWPKVDVVAHSMGGIVARQYIESPAYAQNIDQLILLGSPNRGAPKGYLIWDGGTLSVKDFNSGERILEFALKREAEENGYANLFDYVRRAPILSARELLPIDDYLKDADSGDMRTYYQDAYPRNTLLETLNTEASLAKLEQVQVTNVVGDTGAHGTLESLLVGKPSIQVLDDGAAPTPWEHGKPEGYDALIGDHGLEWGNGDGTVPDASVRAIPATETIDVAAGHSDLPSAARKQVYRDLTGIDPVHAISETPMIDTMLGFFVHSPVDIQIVAPDGKRVGKDFDTEEILNEISGAFYTGFDTKTEFVTIPNPQAGAYTVRTQGMDDGSFRVEGVSIWKSSDSNESEQSIFNLTGTAHKDVMQMQELTLQADHAVVGGDITPPTTAATVTGTQGQNNWYTTDTTVTLAATDNEGGSGVAKTEYSLDNGTTWSVYTQPITITQEGITNVQYRSQDKIGNQETIQAKEVKIDKTAPEAKFVFNLNTQQLDILGQDNLSSSVSVKTIDTIVSIPGATPPTKNFVLSWFSRWTAARKQEQLTTATLADEAGHITKVVFKKEKNQDRRIALTLRSIVYDGSVTDLKDVNLQYKWNTNKKTGKYVVFSAEAQTQDEQIESHYVPWRDMTYLMTRPQALDDEEDDHHFEFRPTWQVLPGMAVLGLETERGRVVVRY